MRTHRNPVGASLAIQNLPIKKTQVTVALCALVAVSVYYLVSRPLYLPENPLDELLAAQPVLAASLVSGNLTLLADTEKAPAGSSTNNRNSRPQLDTVSEPVRAYAWGYSSTRALLPQ